MLSKPMQCLDGSWCYAGWCRKGQCIFNRYEWFCCDEWGGFLKTTDSQIVSLFYNNFMVK